MNTKTYTQPVLRDFEDFEIGGDDGYELSCKAYRLAFNRETTLSEDEIGNIWGEQPDPVMARHMAMLMALAEQVVAQGGEPAVEEPEGEQPEGEQKPAAPKPRAVSVRNSDATALGTELSGNADFIAAMHESLETEKKKRRNAAVVAWTLSQAIEPDRLLAMPVPGMTKDDPKRGNKPYDTRPMSEGGGSYWGDVFDSTPDGKEINKRLKGVTDALGHSTDAPKHLANRDEDYLKKLKSSIQAERTGGVRVLKTAVNALLRIASIKASTHLGVQFITKRIDGKVVLEPNTDILLEVYFFEGEGEQRARTRSYWTLGKFMSVKLEPVFAAKTPEEQWSAFKATRATNARDESENDVDIKNYQQLASVIPAAFWVLDDAEERTQFVKFLKSPQGADTLSKLLKFNREINRILENPAMREVARKLEAEAAEASVAA